jgi:hypothetical protein
MPFMFQSVGTKKLYNLAIFLSSRFESYCWYLLKQAKGCVSERISCVLHELYINWPIGQLCFFIWHLN